MLVRTQGFAKFGELAYQQHNVIGAVKMNTLRKIGFSLAAVLLAPTVGAFPLSFSNTSNNGGTDVAGNFSVDVTENSGDVKFEFLNVQNIDEAREGLINA